MMQDIENTNNNINNIDDDAGTLITSKFQELQSTFDGFSEQLDRQKKSKSEEIERKIASLKEDIEKTQNVIVLEKRSHAESMRALQTWLEDQLTTLVNKIEKPIYKKLNDLDNKINMVDERVTVVETNVLAKIEKIPPIIDENKMKLQNEIKAVERRFEHSTQDLERIEIAFTKIQEVETKLAAKIDEETQQRAIRDGELNVEINKEIDSRHNAIEKVWQHVKDNVKVIKHDIKEEVVSRKKADDALVNAIQSTTLKLKDSIRVIADNQ